MTFKERYEKDHPYEKLDPYRDANQCPYKYGYEDTSPCNEYSCVGCWNREMPTEIAPGQESEPEPNANPVRFEIFTGRFTGNYAERKSASDVLNVWLADHPNVDILDFKYAHIQSPNDDHSICIMYKEVEK